MKKILTACSAIFFLFASIGTTVAATYGVTSRAALAGDDSVDWGQLGTPIIPYVPIPAHATSANGIGLAVSNPPYTVPLMMAIAHGANAIDNAIGNELDFGLIIPFNTGNQLITLTAGPGPMTIDFDQPVYGLGAQMSLWGGRNQVSPPPQFSAFIEAFDSNWKSLGRASFNNLKPAIWPNAWNSYTGNPRPAPFIGIRSDKRDISHVVIAQGQSAFWINQLDLVTVPSAIPATAVPSSPSGEGLMLLPQCQKTAESTMGEKFTVTSIQTDTHLAPDNYTTTFNTTQGSYSYRSYSSNGTLPVTVQIDGVSATLADLKGLSVKVIKVLQDFCVSYDPQANDHIQRLQLAFTALTNNGGGNQGGGNQGGGNQGGGNGGGNQQQPMEAQGFITVINGSSITLDKEGTITVVNVTSQTTVTLNGKPSTLNALQQGDKAATLYDSGTGNAQQLDAER